MLRTQFFGRLKVMQCAINISVLIPLNIQNIHAILAIPRSSCPELFCNNMYSQKVCKIPKETPVPESFLIKLQASELFSKKGCSKKFWKIH